MGKMHPLRNFWVDLSRNRRDLASDAEQEAKKGSLVAREEKD